MRFLLIDNSNTRTKLAFGSENELEDWFVRIPTAEVSEHTLSQALEGQEWDATLLCSVVPEKAAIIKDTLSDKPFHQLTHQSKLGVGIDYPNPAQIGADRLANSIAAHQLYGAPTIVIDFGTAVTFDIILPANTADKANYVGGVIAPGLGAMTDYLTKKTALLPKIELTEPDSAIGKSTEQAMDIGAVYGYRGLVKEIIAQLSKEVTSTPTIVCTGGDGALIAEGVKEIHHFHPTITIEGIRIAASLQFCKS